MNLEAILARTMPVPESGCWLWEGSKMQGYGVVVRKRKPIRLHRLVYEAMVGPIGDGLVIDHLCRVRCCLNPAHMEPVTPEENTRRGFGIAAQNRRKTHCKRGHPFDKERLGSDGLVWRICSTCNDQQLREAHARDKAARDAYAALKQKSPELADRIVSGRDVRAARIDLLAALGEEP